MKPPSVGCCQLFLHRLFEIGVIVKGIDGVLEFICGLLLLSLTKAQLTGILLFLTQRELTENPPDKFSQYLLSAVSHWDLGAKHFATFYLIFHGLVKVFLVYHLLRERLWIFPVSIAVLSAFIGFQLHRLSFHYSNFLLGLTVFDVIVILFILSEYRVRWRVTHEKDRGVRDEH